MAGGSDARAASRTPLPLVDVAIVALSLALVAVTALVLAAPTLAPGIVSDRLDLAIGTASVLTSGAVAALQWARGRVAADTTALLRASAFTVLTTVNALMLGVLLVGVEDVVGASLDAPEQTPVLLTMTGRAFAAALLVVAGVPLLRGRAMRLAPWSVLVVPSLVVIVVSIVLVLASDLLPTVIGPDALDGLVTDPTAVLPAGTAPVLVGLQASIGTMFLAAAAYAHRGYRDSGRIGEALLAAGLIVAAFSQVHSAIHPGAYASLVTSADLLRLGFAALLLVGIVVDHRDDQRALRRANVNLRRLADAEHATAALEERARLAREIHDGLAQDLWYAKLKQSRLAQLGSLGGDALELSREVEAAIDAALAEARHAVSAMRDGSGAGSLADALARHVDDFSDRFALHAELDVEDDPPPMAPRQQAEILRIVQEAMTNARRHADATVVRVTVRGGDGLRITISDNGRGFEPGAIGGGFGLESMRQRAELIGARLSIESEPRAGTRIGLELGPSAGPVREEGAT